MRLLLRLLPLVLVCAMWGQDQPAASDTSRGGTPAPQPPVPALDPPSPNAAPTNVGPNGGSKDRLFFTLPNFLTLENAKNVPPMTAADKFKTVTRSAFDPAEFAWYGALSGLSQWEGSEKGFGEGMEGYGKRFGSYFADGTIENYMTGAVLPSLFHQDPRYFVLGEGGFWHRAGYAVSRIFVTRSDAGTTQFNLSEILGSAMSAGISTYSYHPQADRNLPNTLSVWGSQVGYDTLTYVVREFWPDIRRKLHHSPSHSETR